MLIKTKYSDVKYYHNAIQYTIHPVEEDKPINDKVDIRDYTTNHSTMKSNHTVTFLSLALHTNHSQSKLGRIAIYNLII